MGKKEMLAEWGLNKCPECGNVKLYDNSEMKTHPKSPDFKCSKKGCNGAIWLSKEQRSALGLGEPEILSFEEIKQRKAQKKEERQNNYNNLSGGDRFNGDVPYSMYSAWAKDFAIYLANKNDVRSWDDLKEYFDTCIKMTKEILDANRVIQPVPESQQVKQVKTTDTDMDNVIDDFNMDVEETKQEEAITVDDTFADLDIDI